MSLPAIIIMLPAAGTNRLGQAKHSAEGEMVCYDKQIREVNDIKRTPTDQYKDSRDYLIPYGPNLNTPAKLHKTRLMRDVDEAPA